MAGAGESQFERAGRVAAIEISEIVRISEAAARLRAEGRDIVSLGTGEPDFDTPDHVKQAAVDAIWKGETKYPATRGTAVLHRAICEKFSRENGLDFNEDEIIVSTGAKQVLFNAFMATLETGDQVIIGAPYWTSYVDIVTICGARSHIVTAGAEAGFKISPEQLEDAIGPRTRWLLLNSPSNPSGAVYDANELSALGQVLARHPHVWLMADEIYEHLIYDDGDYRSARSVLPQLVDRTLIVNGVSKAYAMTGWRLGFGAGPAPLIAAMVAVQGQATSGASSISQAAAVAALTGPQDHIAQRRAAFRARRDLVVAALSRADGITCQTPAGAFYVFPSCTGVYGRKTPDGDVLNDDADFCNYLLRQESVAVVPGRAFGAPGHFRISYAYSTEALEEAASRIQRACGELV